MQRQGKIIRSPRYTIRKKWKDLKNTKVVLPAVMLRVQYIGKGIASFLLFYIVQSQLCIISSYQVFEGHPLQAPFRWH